jgi:hypothetical protein
MGCAVVGAGVVETRCTGVCAALCTGQTRCCAVVIFAAAAALRARRDGLLEERLEDFLEGCLEDVLEDALEIVFVFIDVQCWLVGLGCWLVGLLVFGW